MMNLVRFRVTNFRSVIDSGWIDVDTVTALIGTNESGKTNLLVPLWKFHPAKDGHINPIADYPRSAYNAIKKMDKKPVFIEVCFELTGQLLEEMASLTGYENEAVQYVHVQRDFAGHYTTSFPGIKQPRSVEVDEVRQLLVDASMAIQSAHVLKSEETLKERMLEVLTPLQEEMNALVTASVVEASLIARLVDELNGIDLQSTAKRSMIIPRFQQLLDDLEEILEALQKPLPHEDSKVRECILKNMPFFVYYSHYGNLDSEIYLPHVIENMSRTDLGSREEAKARTLRVLFDFVNLQPQEILELGRETDGRYAPVTQEDIHATAERKKEREVLLQSASSDLTSKFREWWKQGEYRFLFSADGNHFRIWVSDDKRPEPIELESRSTGLQWFLSFYLVFLVESQATHQGAILLLDEPGLSLHPLAQGDLSLFFENLAKQNQLIYTTHSPFMVDPDHLDRVKAVYIDDKGTTRVSSNLRAGEGNSAESRSIYPVHAALGLSVSTMLLQGCQAIIVEGPSDQIYLSAIKNYLINKGRLTPNQELLFVPAGGAGPKGIAAVTALLTSKEDHLPYILLDGDRTGIETKNKLKTSLYQHDVERLITIDQIRNLPHAEIEDLFPGEFLASIITRYLPSAIKRKKVGK